MLFAFNSSSAMFISVIATFLSGLFVIFGGSAIGIPMPVGIALIILSGTGLAVLLSSVPKLYSETLKSCNDDIDGFVKEQRAVSNRCFGKRRLSAQMNLVFGLIAHECLDEAESLLIQTAPYAERSETSYKLEYLLLNLMISGRRKNFENLAYTFERLMNELNANHGIFILEKDEYEHLAEIIRLETAFFSLSPDSLSPDKMQIIEQLNFLARKYLSTEHFMNEHRNDYLNMHFNYILGVTYAIKGDMRSAEFYLGSVASLPFTYPENARARYFLQTKNIKTFF